jgi:hypothetical protein
MSTTNEVCGSGWAIKAAADLKEGDRFRTHGTVVRVLHDAWRTTEAVAPLAGRPCITLWGEREDTGARGSMTFGPFAAVQTETPEEG